jgi:bifunctional N-acetylglucosamine-1-phosphate-uridyltransferase/glucosamine-1-phosphate-acetyltransferase GlmU-like protein
MKNKARYLAIILAAGKGSRLSTNIPKPLYEIDGLPIIDHIIKSISAIPDTDILTVVGHEKNKVINHIKDKSSYVIQKTQNGTGDAVLRCVDYIKEYEDILVFVGDTPFIDSRVILSMILKHKLHNADCTFLYSQFPFDLPYARLFFDRKNKLIKLVESKYLNKEQKKIRNLFTSQYLFKSKLLLGSIDEIYPDIKTKEYNFTDIINIYIEKKYKINPVLVHEFWSLMGINTLDDIKLLKSYNKR